jgi:hypothetical protein
MRSFALGVELSHTPGFGLHAGVRDQPREACDSCARERRDRAAPEYHGYTSPASELVALWSVSPATEADVPLPAAVVIVDLQQQRAF